ncbi:MAG TPA: hypothetical protein VFF31_01310 [Blastocatellia bacterium]|nr:hypothetical protein [Blastocatellia bacterium]
MRLNRLNPSVLCVLFTATCCLAGQSPQSINGSAPAGEVRFSYKFENPRFHLRVIEIDIAADGAGELRFVRGESDELLDCKLKLLPATLARIRSLIEIADLLGSTNEYQDKIDMSHLGWITIGAKQGARERKVRFNHTINEQMKELGDIFRGIATQEISLFDIDNAQRYQPLDLPKQLEVLESDLRLEWIAEPERVLKVLIEIAGDDTQPLIARNHARRIIEAIKKGKYKSPVKK